MMIWSHLFEVFRGCSTQIASASCSIKFFIEFFNLNQIKKEVLAIATANIYSVAHYFIQVSNLFGFSRVRINP